MDHHGGVQRDLCGPRARPATQDPLEPLIEALTNGDSIILFPEGTRGNHEEPQTFKAGLYNLALKFPGVVLVPAWINNVQRVMPKGEVVPVPILCSVTFGAPIALGVGEDRGEFLARARQAVDGSAGILMNTPCATSPSHQVGLLFVLVFGILAAISVAAFVMSLKDTHEDDLHTQKLKEFNGVLRTSWLMSTGVLDRLDAGRDGGHRAVRLVAFFRAARVHRRSRPRARATTAAWCWPSSWCCRCSSRW